MRKWTYYEYDNGIPDEDRYVLEQKKDIILGALMDKAVFWKMLKDSNGRNHYYALAYSDRSKVLCQLFLDDIRSLDDKQLKNRIVNGDFSQREIP
jgi:hypothetical protein